jgi:glucuronoarabinoxylan endo-1,4-beta-xylanase
MVNKKVVTAAVAFLLLAAVLVISACTEMVGAEPPKRSIMKPYISVQPASYSYHVGSYTTAPTLNFKIWDWEEEDGELSYQWFTFTSIEAYCTGGGTEVVPATGIDLGTADGNNVITISYTPTGVTATAGRQYFYYAVVTNTNPKAGGSTTASVQSEIAVLSFSASGDPLVPIIVKNPTSATYGWGETLNTLRVNAKLATGSSGTLTYKWYTNSAFSLTNGKLIAGENQNFFMPDYDDLDLEENYYFVEVINEEGGKTAVARSIPAIITMEPGLRAATPTITVFPKDSFVFTGGTFDDLSVEGTSPDRGTISYQWYSNTTFSNSGGTAISGANRATYKPTVSNSSANNYFYYAVVTNTNTKVKGKTTATASTGTVRVTVASPAASNPAVNIYMKIPDTKQSSNRYQYIRGYGGMEVAWGNFPRTSQADTELMYDPDRLGYNMLRIMIKADYVDPADTINMLLTGDRPDYFENVKIVNKYGGYVAASPWTPPKNWKSNNSINGGGNLIPRYYPLFAQYLRNFAQIMYDNGAPIYCISISNEPNYVAGYDGCEWTPEEMRDFFKEQGHFTDGIRGWGGGKEIPYVLTMNGESANTPYINNAALQDPESRAVIDVLARHVYGSRTESLWNNFPELLQKGSEDDLNKGRLEVWMTEHNINSANATGYYNDSKWPYVWRFMNDVDLVIRLNNENAFVWWASKRFYSMVGDGQFGTTDGAPLPRGWGLAHYSRFTIGMDRVKIELDTTGGKVNKTKDGTEIRNADRETSNLNRAKDDMDNDSIRVTAFASQDNNEISLILWTPTKPTGTGGYNVGTFRIQLPDDFVANGMTAVMSNGDRPNQLFQPFSGVQLSSDRKMAYITMDKGQLVSIKFTK